MLYWSFYDQQIYKWIILFRPSYNQWASVMASSKPAEYNPHAIALDKVIFFLLFNLIN